MSDKKHKLGLFMLIALVTGNMIGSGAFLMPASLARIGSISLLSLVFTAVGALCLALVFAKMSLLIPKAGGPYAFTFAAFGEYMGFQTAYYYWIAIWVSNAALVVAVLGYLNVLFTIANSHIAKNICIFVVIWVPTIVNLLGIRYTGVLQIVTTILKFIPFVIIGTIGWYYFHPEYLTQDFNVTSQSNLSAFYSAATLTLWLFVGVESATVPADSVHNPNRNIPLATLLGTIIAAVIYIISFVAMAGILPANILAASSSPFALAVGMIFGRWGEALVAVGAIVACLGALNGWVLLSAQVPMVAADDGLFPKIFAKHRKESGIPVYGLIISSILTSLLMLAMSNLDLIAQFNFLVDVTVATLLIAYFYTAAAEIIILPKQHILNRKNIMHIVIAILAAIYSFFALFGSSKEIIFYIMAFILSSVPLYAWFCWKRKT